MIELYDTTLRDGTQGEGVSLTAMDKVRITALLDEFGIPLIEGGWPGSNPKDIEYFRKIRGVDLEQARIAAFGSTCRPNLRPEDDGNLKALLDSDAPVATIFGKSWTRHVTRVLRTDLETNLRLIEGSVEFLKRAGRQVIYDAEHFFDGYQEDSAYALSTLMAAVRGGAECVVLCDTNGGTMPWQVEEIVATVVASLGVRIGIHAHNDGGCAVANSLAAVRAGAVHVQGTFNGIGERCGNADLVPIAANLELKLHRAVLPPGRLSRLTEVARAVSEICNLTPQPQAPYVGRSAFAHKAGVHVAALQRDAGAYEHIDPARIGNTTRVLVSELSGRGNVRSKAEEFGLGAGDSDAHLALLSQIKELENQGFSFEAAEASLEVMMRRREPDFAPFFELIDFLVVVEHRERRGLLAESNVKIRVGEEVFHTAAEGVGPVGALDTALRKALHDVYPEIDRFHLVDYKVRVLDGVHGTTACTRVLIESRDDEGSWCTVGASRNIIEASWQALYDSFEYGLLKHRGAAKTGRLVAKSA